jgi:hypothetical protein
MTALILQVQPFAEILMCMFVRAIRTHVAGAVVRARALASNLNNSRAATRRQREILEAELFRGRCHLSSKNDDDLPVVC